MLMPGKSIQPKTYRYGFNGMEKDDEVKGSGNSYTAEYWQYDSRLGRRWNQDIVEKAAYSGYAVLGNNPIIYIDKNGDDWFIYYKKGFFSDHSFKLIWLNASAVIYDPEQYGYISLGKSLSIGKLDKYAAEKWGEGLGKILTAPLKAYMVVLVNKDHYKALMNKGYNEYGKMVESSKIPGLHYTPKGDWKTDMSTKVFKANEKVTVNNFYEVIMYSFITGDGPENFYFDKDHSVSKSLENSQIVRDAIEAYKKGDIKEGEWTGVELNESEIGGVLNRAKEHDTALTPEHLVGNAEIMITENEDGKTLDIKIWNTTSVGSGTLGMPRLPRPKSDKGQPFTNVSQTFEITVNK